MEMNIILLGTIIIHLSYSLDAVPPKFYFHFLQ
jgi:hypothetical protein